MKKRYAVHRITEVEEPGFDPIDYSRFKFGDGEVARQFGFSLADGFIETFMPALAGRQLVVLASPYRHIPTASYYMTRYFVNRLNRYLAEQGYPVVQESKIYRAHTYACDYGSLNAEEREALISNDEFMLDKHFLEGDKVLVFIDDIKITGSHESVINKALQKYHLSNEHIYVYFAELLNTSIAPQFENELNYAYVQNLANLATIVKSPNFCINTRLVKYILSSPLEEVQEFVQDLEEGMLETLYDYAIGNNYHQMPEYQVCITYLHACLEQTEYVS